jgi:hypothetical protein
VEILKKLVTTSGTVAVKVKQSSYRPEVAQRVPES